jgi:hypothetical protein
MSDNASPMPATSAFIQAFELALHSVTSMVKQLKVKRSDREASINYYRLMEETQRFEFPRDMPITSTAAAAPASAAAM